LVEVLPWIEQKWCMAHEQLIPGDPLKKNDSAVQPTNSPVLAAQRKWFLFPHPVAWLVLVISLAATAGGWFIAWQHAELAARKRFDEEAGRITAALEERMQIYEDVLHGGVGLFAASYTVERAEWRTYLESVSIERRFPGIDGVGFIAHVPQEKLDEFVKLTRADKTPGSK
jgi:CHASE1-domain containing sensor protein